jgi:hypothetical protein
MLSGPPRPPPGGPAGGPPRPYPPPPGGYPPRSPMRIMGPPRPPAGPRSPGAPLGKALLISTCHAIKETSYQSEWQHRALCHATGVKCRSFRAEKARPATTGQTNQRDRASTSRPCIQGAAGGGHLLALDAVVAAIHDLVHRAGAIERDETETYPTTIVQMLAINSQGQF